MRSTQVVSILLYGSGALSAALVDRGAAGTGPGAELQSRGGAVARAELSRGWGQPAAAPRGAADDEAAHVIQARWDPGHARAIIVVRQIKDEGGDAFDRWSSQFDKTKAMLMVARHMGLLDEKDIYGYLELFATTEPTDEDVYRAKRMTPATNVYNWKNRVWREWKEGNNAAGIDIREFTTEADKSAGGGGKRPQLRPAGT